MRSTLFSAAMLSAAAMTTIAYIPAQAQRVCLWGNAATQLERSATGALIQWHPGFTIASGSQADTDRPFWILLDADQELPSECTATDAAVREAYRANNTVQAAIEADVCKHPDDMEDHDEAMSRLSPANRTAYDAVRAKLAEAYAASPGTDSELEAVQKDFCDQLSER